MATRLDFSRRNYNETVKVFEAKELNVYMDVAYNADGFLGTGIKQKKVYQVYFEDGKHYYFDTKESADKIFYKKVQLLKDLLS